MKCRTHIVISNSLSLLLLRPNTIEEIITCMTFASIGGIICDLDNKKKNNSKIINTLLISIAVLLLIGFIVDKKFNLLIFNKSLIINIIGLILISLLCIYGSNKPHHSFLHSMLGISLIVAITYIFIGNVYLPILIGMVSHVLLDIFNYMPVLLAYPYKRGICFKKCSWNGKEDKIVFIIGLIAILIELIILL